MNSKIIISPIPFSEKQIIAPVTWNDIGLTGELNYVPTLFLGSYVNNDLKYNKSYYFDTIFTRRTNNHCDYFNLNQKYSNLYQFESQKKYESLQKCVEASDFKTVEPIGIQNKIHWAMNYW